MPPMIGNSGATQETHFSINDDQFTVRPVVSARPVVPAHRMVPGHLASRLTQILKEFLWGCETAYRVYDQIHLHPGACSLCERIHNPSGNVPFGEDVSFPVKAF